MKPITLDEWIAAMESGHYNQGTGHLHYAEEDEHRYCCLGVACHIAGGEWQKCLPSGESSTYYEIEGATATLPGIILNELGEVGEWLCRRVGGYGPYDRGKMNQAVVIEINDTTDLDTETPFKRVVEFIKSHR